ncbi:MAG: ABC transporter ATP-binding protein [Verrucomicrobiota bacterium]
MIEFQNVTKYYPTKTGRHYIFRDVSFVLESQTNIGLLGTNGAGKSTMMRLIGGSENPSDGKIIKDCSVSWPLGLAGGFQGSMTGVENVRFICRIYGLNSESTQEVVDFVTEFSEIGKFMDMPVKTYSSGMRARVTFGLSLSMHFDVYLVDELTSVGDPPFRAKAEKAFEELKDRSTIVYVSHNLKTVAEVCDRVAILHRGEFHFFSDVLKGIEVYQQMIGHRSKPEELPPTLKSEGAQAKQANKTTLVTEPDSVTPLADTNSNLAAKEFPYYISDTEKPGVTGEARTNQEQGFAEPPDSLLGMELPPPDQLKPRGSKKSGASQNDIQ